MGRGRRVRLRYPRGRVLREVASAGRCDCICSFSRLAARKAAPASLPGRARVVPANLPPPLDPAHTICRARCSDRCPPMEISRRTRFCEGRGSVHHQHLFSSPVPNYWLWCVREHRDKHLFGLPGVNRCYRRAGRAAERDVELRRSRCPKLQLKAAADNCDR